MQAEGRFSIRTPLKRHQVSELLCYTQAWAQRAMINQSPKKPGLEAGEDSTSLVSPTWRNMLLLLRTQILEKPCLGRRQDKWEGAVGGQ